MVCSLLVLLTCTGTINYVELGHLTLTMYIFPRCLSRMELSLCISDNPLILVNICAAVCGTAPLPSFAFGYAQSGPADSPSPISTVDCKRRLRLLIQHTTIVSSLRSNNVECVALLSCPRNARSEACQNSSLLSTLAQTTKIPRKQSRVKVLDWSIYPCHLH